MAPGWTAGRFLEMVARRQGGGVQRWTQQVLFGVQVVAGHNRGAKGQHHMGKLGMPWDGAG